MGTLVYMAPEQLRDAKRADQRSDVYSLGVILRELYTGDVFDSADSHMPAGVGAVVERCTQMDPAKRYTTVSELLSSYVRLTETPKAEKARDDLKEYVALFQKADELITDSEYERLADAISTSQEDEEAIHGLAIVMPQSAFTELYRRYPEIADLMVRQFANSCSASFGFDYTDRIGSACRRLYFATSDPQIRAHLAATALQVGASHNRFYVMEVAAELIHSVENDQQAVAMFTVLEPLQQTVATIERYLDVLRLHPILRTLIQAEASNDPAG